MEWNEMDLIWILDEEWGCLQRSFRGKKRTFSYRLLKNREGGGQITD